MRRPAVPRVFRRRQLRGKRRFRRLHAAPRVHKGVDLRRDVGAGAVLSAEFVRAAQFIQPSGALLGAVAARTDIHPIRILTVKQRIESVAALVKELSRLAHLGAVFRELHKLRLQPLFMDGSGGIGC